MSRYTLGVLLRMLGFLVEFGALIAYLNFGRRGTTLGGVSLDALLFAAFGLGLLMVVVGLSLSAFRRRRPVGGRGDFDLDLGNQPAGADHRRDSPRLDA